MNRTSSVNEDLSFTSAFCSEYEALLDQCQLALSAWSERSEYALQAHITGEAVGRELLRPQARFAKAYGSLQKHVHSCERCVAAAQIAQLRLDGVPQNSLAIC